MALYQREQDYGGVGFGYFLFGAIVGTVAGLLLAPKSGIEIREDLNDWIEDKRERTNKVVSRLKERMPAAAEKMEEAQESFSGGKINDRRL